MSWATVGRQEREPNVSDLIKLENNKRLRLLLPPEGPIQVWKATISTPGGDFRSWVAPPKEQDFFAKNRNVFKARSTHAGHAWDYDEGRVGILEAGNQIWESLKQYVDRGVDLSVRDIMITKTGEKRDTKYGVIVLDPSEFNVTLPPKSEWPKLEDRYQPATYEQVLQDLVELGFPNPEEIWQMRELPLEVAQNYEIPFGKHRGKTLKEVYTQDTSYITFLATKINREDLKQAARVVSNAWMGTDYPVEGVAPTMEEITYIKPEKEGEQAAPPKQDIPPKQDTPPWDDKPGDNNYQMSPAPAPAPAPAPQQANGGEREALEKEINKIFETKEEYKDFLKIIEVMKAASAPHGKTSIKDFTLEELRRLKDMIS